MRNFSAFGALVARKLIALTLVLITLSPAAAAPPAPGGAAAAERAAPDAMPLEAEALSQRIEAVRNDAALEPASRDEAVSSYNAALDFIRSAESWRFKASKYDRLVEEAAGHLERLHTATAAPPAPPAAKADLDLPTLEQRALELRGLLGEKRAELDDVASEQQRRATRRLEIPTRASEVRRRLGELRAETVMAEAGASKEPGRAKYVRAQAETRAYAREAEALDAEVASYDARRELLTLRRDAAAREIAAIQGAYEALQGLVDEKRQAEAEKAAVVASGAAEEAKGDVHPIVRAVAEENAGLATARTGSEGVVSKLERARAFAARIDEREDRLAREFDAIQERARIIGFSGPIGALLRKHKKELPDRAFHREKIRQRQDEIGQVQMALLELEDQRASLADPAAAARYLVHDNARQVQETDAPTVLKELTSLLETKRRYLDTLLADYDAYFFTLVDLDTKERELVEEAADFSRYIDEHVLWIRSTTALDWSSVTGAAEALAWFVHPENGSAIVAEGQSVLRRAPLSVLLVLTLLGILFIARTRVQAVAPALEADATRAATHGVWPLAIDTSVAVLTAVWWPAILFSVGWLIRDATGDHARAISAGLEAIAWFFFILEFARQVFRKQGIGTRYFGWSPRAAEAIRRYVTTAMLAGLPAAFLVNGIHTQPKDAWKESLGRIAFGVTILSIGVLAYRLLRRDGPVMQSIAEHERSYSWLYRARNVAGPAAFAFCALLAVLAALGYYFAALSIGPFVGQTLELGFGLTLVQAMALVWLRVTHGGKASLDAAATASADVEGTGESSDDAAATLATVPQAGGVSARDRRMVGNATAVAFLIGTFLIWRGFLPALNAVNSLELWRVQGQQSYEVQTDAGTETRVGTREIPITLGSLLQALLLLGVATSAARHIPGFIELALKRRLRVDAGVTNAVQTLARYAFVLFGVVSAAATLGLSWGQVQWLAAAVSVGLGFGLQEIFANFVSGLILLFERPIRLGDTVTLGNITGTVSRIQIRATTIIDPDRKELIVPNKEFVTGQLINWTLTDTVLRLTVPVGIAYGADTRLAEKILLETARKNPNVLDDPSPTVTFSSFGDNALQFDVRVFIPHADYTLKTRHMLHMQIEEALRAAGIEIAFPQRDLHIRSISVPVPVKIER